MRVHAPRSLTALALALAALSSCVPGTGEPDDDDFAAADDDDTVGDDDDTVGDDDDTTGGDCWQADTILDVTDAAGPGDGYPSPTLSADCDAEELVVTTNGIPTYTFVEMTPNPLAEAPATYRIPLEPALANAPSDIPLLGLVGFGVNGLPFYGPNEAAFPDPYGDPIWNGITDGCNGHVGMSYHHHALVQKCLTQDAVSVAAPWTLPDPDPTEPSPIIGWSLDGFPVYGPYGCVDADCEEVIEFVSSWVQIGDPTTYAWDAHEYQEQAGAEYLDRCNGRIQPDGTYGYHATATFPYLLGCYVGTPADGAGGDGDDDDDDDDDGPQACNDPADCVGACPPEAVGCTCAETPMGDLCVPTCASDADCDDLPAGPPGGLTCDEAAGICVPAQGGPGGGP